MKIGKAKYGGNKKTYFKIKDGDNVYRILPPIGELADKGIWSMFYRIHYGYKNSEGRLRPFQSSLVKNRTNKMIEVPDAALERIDKLKAELENAKKTGNQALVAKLTEFVGPKGSFNLDSNHYVNAIDTQGNIGILKLRHRCMVALEATIKKLREKNIDPLDPENGRYFVINRSGNALDTTFQVSIATRTIVVPNVGEVQQEIVHALDASTVARLSTDAADLSKLFKKPTAEQVARIVREGATAVDEILDGKGSSTDSSGEDYDDGDDEPTSGTGTTAAAAPVAAQETVTAAFVQTPPTTTPATSGSSLAPANTTQVTTVAQATPVQAPPVQASAPVAPAPAGSTAAHVAELSDDAFLKSLNL